MQALAPFLVRVVRLAQRASDIEASALLAGLDRSRTAAVLLGDNGDVLGNNECAEALLGTGKLMISGRRLRVGDATDEKALQALIHGAVRDHAQTTRPVVLLRDGLPWLYVEAAPLTRAMKDTFGAARALVFFSPIAQPHAPQEHLLRAAFGLSSAEARLAVLVAQGSGLVGAAVRLDIGRETAKSQLRPIFEKTDTRRQSELAAIVMSLRAASGT